MRAPDFGDKQGHRSPWLLECRLFRTIRITSFLTHRRSISRAQWKPAARPSSTSTSSDPPCLGRSGRANALLALRRGILRGELRRPLRTWRRPRLRWRPGLRRTPIDAYIESPSTVPKIVGTGQEPPPCPTGVGCNGTAQRSSTGTSAARHLLPSKLEPLRARENRSSCRPWFALAQHWSQAFQARAGTPQDAQQLH